MQLGSRGDTRCFSTPADFWRKPGGKARAYPAVDRVTHPRTQFNDTETKSSIKWAHAANTTRSGVEKGVDGIGDWRRDEGGSLFDVLVSELSPPRPADERKGWKRRDGLVFFIPSVSRGPFESRNQDSSEVPSSPWLRPSLEVTVVSRCLTGILAGATSEDWIFDSQFTGIHHGKRYLDRGSGWDRKMETARKWIYGDV